MSLLRNGGGSRQTTKFRIIYTAYWLRRKARCGWWYAGAYLRFLGAYARWVAMSYVLRGAAIGYLWIDNRVRRWNFSYTWFVILAVLGSVMLRILAGIVGADR